MKKGRHRRYEEARALKRGPDLDINALFTDLGGEDGAPAPVEVSDELDDDADDDTWEYPEEDEDDW